MKSFQKQRLLKLADFLKKLPKRLFDLSLIVSVKEPENGFAPNCSLSTAIKCGTTACAIGWCPTVFPRHLKWDANANTVQLKSVKDDKKGWNNWDDYEAEDFGAVEKFFGIDNDQSEYLFMPESYTNENETTAKEVAKRIEKFVKDDGVIPEDHRSNDW